MKNQYLTTLIGMCLLCSVNMLFGEEEGGNSDVPSMIQIFSKIKLRDDCVVTANENALAILYEHLKKGAQKGQVTVLSTDDTVELAISVDMVRWGWDFKMKKKEWVFKRGEKYLDCLIKVAGEHKAKIFKRSWGIMLLKEKSDAQALILKVTPKSSEATVHNALYKVGRAHSSFLVEDDGHINLKDFIDYLNQSYARKKPTNKNGNVNMAYHFESVSKKQDMKILSVCGYWTSSNMMELYSVSQGAIWRVSKVDDIEKSFIVSLEFPERSQSEVSP